MAAGRIVVPPYFPARNRDFDLLSGAKLYVYDNETTTKADIYTDEALTVLSANPVIANSAGQFPAIYAEAGTEAAPVLYSVSVTTSTGASPGNPFNFDNYRPSVDWETAAVALAEAAADAAGGSAAEAAADLTSVESIYDDILAIEATGSDAPAIAARALRDGSNLTGSEPASFLSVLNGVSLTSLASQTGASLVGFLQAGVGAVLRTMQSKSQDWVDARDFGLVAGAFASVQTAAARRAFDYAFANKKTLRLSGAGGAYAANAQWTTQAQASGSMFLELEGPVVINVDPTSTAFDNVIGYECTDVADFVISGSGTLTIDGGDKAGCGLYFRHLSTTYGGQIHIDPFVKVSNMNGSATTAQNGGIVGIGRFTSIYVNSPEVDEVERRNVTGETSGVTFSGYVGRVYIPNLKVSNIRNGSGTVDVDGYRGFGLQVGTAENERLGESLLTAPIFENCQGRSYKSQDSHSKVASPLVRRDAAVMVSNANSVEFDFQFGNGDIENARYEYAADGATLPVPANHSMVVFQNILDNASMSSSARNATLLADFAVPRYALLINYPDSLNSETIIDGLTLIPTNGYAGSLIDRAVVETNMATVAEKPGTTAIRVKNVIGPCTAPHIGYTDYATVDTGTATAGGATTLTNSAESWTVNEYAGFELRITAGTGSGQRRTIASNTATILTVSVAWATNPDATSVYAVLPSLETKLTWDAGQGCHNTLGAASGTRSFQRLSGETVLAVKQFRNIPSEGFVDRYATAGFVCDFTKLTTGTTLTVDIATGTFTNPPGWGASGEGHIRVESQWANGNFRTIWVLKDGGSATPSFWVTQDSGVNWNAIK